MTDGRRGIARRSDDGTNEKYGCPDCAALHAGSTTYWCHQIQVIRTRFESGGYVVELLTATQESVEVRWRNPEDCYVQTPPPEDLCKLTTVGGDPVTYHKLQESWGEAWRLYPGETGMLFIADGLVGTPGGDLNHKWPHGLGAS